MCDSWKSDFAKEFNCEGMVLDSGDGEYIVKGKVKNGGNSNIMFWAPNPPTYVTSYAGSGLPFANPEMAYDNTPNKGMVKAKNGSFEFKVRYPNSYYMGLGTVCVEPCCHIKICGKKSDNKIHTIKLGNGIPFRMLTYPPTSETGRPRSSATFYSGGWELPVRTQEQICRDSGYPEVNKMPKDFWGLTPPN